MRNCSLNYSSISSFVAPNKFTNINKSSPTSNVLNNRLAPQMLVNSNNNNSTQQYLSHQRQRSTTLPPEVIVSGFFALFLKII